MSTPGARRRSGWIVPSAVVACFVAAVVPSARADIIQHIRVHYDVYLGGLHVASSQIELRSSSADYTMVMTAEPHGILAAIVDFLLTVDATGRIEDGDVRPASFRWRTERTDEPRVREVVFREDGSVEILQAPENERNDEPIAPDLLAGAIDPMSVAVLVGQAINSGEVCTRSVAVYDGRRRYDIVIQQVGPMRLRPSQYAVYDGLAVLCRGSLEPVAGPFRPPSSNTFWRHPSESERGRFRQMDMWLAAPVEGGPVLPVRAEATTSRGAVAIHLSSVDIIEFETEASVAAE